MLDKTVAASPHQKIGKYRIDAVLGEGAMGVVYQAFDPAIERTVAIKTIREAGLSDDAREEFRARFKREAQAAGRLAHPNIVAVHKYGETADLAFIVMEYVEGRSLKDAIEAGEAFGLDRVLAVILEVLDALDHAHDHGVIHRDLKPANILLTRQGHVKLTDFGIARLEGLGMTQSGTILGTSTYMSPEQVQGKAITAATDLYSLGVVLYDLLAEEKPFTGNTAASVMHKIVTVVPPLPSGLNTGVPAWLDGVVAKALAKAPADRFQTARDFADALRRAGRAEPVIDAGRRPRKWIIGFAVMAFALAAMAGGWMLFSFSAGDRQADEAAWHVAEHVGTLEAFRAYVSGHPRGLHAAAATAQAWTLADQAGTIDALRFYVQGFPDGSHGAEANQRIGEWQRAADEEVARQAERRAWEEAERIGTIDGFRTYLSAQPQGAHAEEARQHITILEQAAAEAQAWEQAASAVTLEAFRTYLTLYPQGPHIAQARQRGIAILLDTACGIRDEFSHLKALRDIAVAQARAGDIDAARTTFAAALDQSGRDTRYDDSRYALREIAVAQAQAGDFAAALDTARGIRDESDRAKALGEIALAISGKGESPDDG